MANYKKINTGYTLSTFATKLSSDLIKKEPVWSQSNSLMCDNAVALNIAFYFDMLPLVNFHDT